MKTILIYTVFTLISFSAGALLNIETSNAFYLILASIVLGVLMWAPYLLRERKRVNYSRFEVHSSLAQNFEWNNYVLSYFIFVLGAVIFTSLINAIPLQKNIVLAEGVVTGYTSQHIRHSRFDLLKISMSNGDNVFIHQGGNHIPLGSRFSVKINKGLLRFARVQEYTLVEDVEIGF